jgi:hypothetical protein
MTTEQSGSTVVEVLKRYGVGLSRPALLEEFIKHTGLRGWDERGRYLPEFHLRRGLDWARKRSLVIPNTRRHRGELSYWRYCGDES